MAGAAGGIRRTFWNNEYKPPAGGASGGSFNWELRASYYNSIYGNSTTVTDEQVRLRHFVVLASAQNSASVFDWSNYMAGLAGKANLDMNNLTQAGTTAIAHNSLPSSSRIVALAIPADASSVNAPGDGYVKFVATASAANQYIRLWFGALDTCIWSSAAGQLLSVCVPCLKNQPVFVAGTAPASRALQFIYANGAN